VFGTGSRPMSFLSVESVVPSVPCVVPSLRSELFWSGNTHFYIRPAATSTVPSASAVAVCQAPSFEERCRDETARTEFTSSYPLMVDAAWLHTTVTQIQAGLGPFSDAKTHSTSSRVQGIKVQSLTESLTKAMITLWRR